MIGVLNHNDRTLVLDTDWISALVALGSFLGFGFLATLNFIKIVRGVVPAPHVTWETWMLFAFWTWLFITSKDRRIRVLSAMVALEEISKIALWGLKASIEVQLANLAIIRVVNEFLFVAACIYAVWWFCSKIRRFEGIAALEKSDG